MSQPHTSDRDSLPSAILVEPPIYAKRAKSRSRWREIQLWWKIVIGGAVAWTAVLVVGGVYVLMTAGNEPIALADEPLPDIPAKRVFAEGPAPAPVEAANMPAVKEPVAKNPGQAAPKVNWNKGEIVQCARIGTEVRFLKDPALAFKRAREERKLVFMMHLSGNLEDQAFT